ncbi:MAG TPA: two-component regulator propeller domain-containing protein [Prolixibacteraceae bacterium]|jgi:signal transduction histidine kinase/ligand-binding sensor domain-containing protein
MKLFFRQLILASLLFLANESLSQTKQVKFNLFTGTNGVTLGKINGMTRDKYGFMWFSDQSNRCIIRFDGSYMTRYQNDPKNPNSLGGYYPECLFPDANGNIWIGFYGMGIDKFDPVARSFTHYRHNKNDPESLSDDTVSALLIDHLGNIWVGTNGGLDLLDEKTGKFKHFNYKANDPSSLSYNIVRAIYEDKKGELWVGTGFAFSGDNDGGLNRYNRKTGTFTRYLNNPKDPQTLINNKVRAIFEDSYGNFWIGTNGDGLHTMDRKTGLFTRHTYNPIKPDELSRTSVKDYTDHITFITEDADKKIWIGTLMNGIIRYDPHLNKMSYYGNKNDKVGALKDSTSWWANATPDGFIWLSTQNANLFKIDIYNTTIPHYGTTNDDAVFTFYEEPDSVMWYGTGKGLIRKDFKTGIIRRFVNEPGNTNSLSNNVITQIIKDKHGDFWIGTFNGLNHFNIKSEKIKRYYHDHNNNAAIGVYCLCEDNNSNIWAGMAGNPAVGLDMLNPQTGKIINYRNDPADINTLSNDVITTILKDETNYLWIGTDNSGGLNKLNLNTLKFTHYLSGLVITCLYRDADGIIWVGSPSGLFSYDKQTDNFNSIADGNLGIIVVQIESITGDKEDNLWIATESGIYMLNKKRDFLVRFGKEYGLQDANNFFYIKSSFTTHNGEVNFGHALGYYAFNPEKLRISPGKTELYFTRFWLDNKEILPANSGPLQTSLYNTKEIRLNHNQNIFSFNATFVDFRNAGDKKIFYKLENFDKDWHSAGAEERIQYFKVPHGRYIFRIKTPGSSNGEWLEKSIVIIISPPWWSTWWAFCIYGLLFIVVVLLIHRYQKEKLLKTERERTRAKELAQAKEIEKAYTELKATQAQLIQSEKMASLGELTAGIAHEIQNPLNFVNNFSEVSNELIDEMNVELDKGDILEAKVIASDIKQNLEKILHHGKRADQIVKGMLLHSRSSSGVKEPTDINQLADEYFRLAYHGLRARDKSFNAIMKSDFDQSIGNITIIPQDIGRVILNLITNAFYAVTEKKKQQSDAYEPTVWVSTKKVEDKVLISVKDNGMGIPSKIRDKIFQPFFTTKPTGEGTGLGLSMSFDIVKAHGGELKVDSQEGKGAEFTISLQV